MLTWWYKDVMWWWATRTRSGCTLMTCLPYWAMSSDHGILSLSVKVNNDLFYSLCMLMYPGNHNTSCYCVSWWNTNHLCIEGWMGLPQIKSQHAKNKTGAGFSDGWHTTTTHLPTMDNNNTTTTTTSTTINTNQPTFSDALKVNSRSHSTLIPRQTFHNVDSHRTTRHQQQQQQ